MSGQLAISAWLAWRDWKHEIFLSLCAVLALVSMLSPILVLIGLKNGVVDGMRKRLMEDPAVLVIMPKSDAGQFSGEFISGLGKLPGARFAIGRTRDSTTDFTFQNVATGAKCVVALEPAAAGEPILESQRMPIPKNGLEPEIVLSRVAATTLGVVPGGLISIKLGRNTPRGRLESTEMTFRVAAILPPEVADRRMGFVALGTMEDIQDYLDYLAVPARGLAGDARQGERRYSAFRLYAKDLASVEPLAETLKERRIETITRSRDIAVMLNLEKSINNIILIIAAAIGAGFIAFTISSVQGSVLRKRKQLALLRLFGLKRLQLICFPLVQIFLTLVTGFLASLGVYGAVAAVIAKTFASQGNLQCLLTVANVASIAITVFVLSSLACAWGAWKSASIEPSTVIRSE